MIEKIKKNKIAVLLVGLVLVVGLYFVFTNSRLLNDSKSETKSPAITSESEQAVEPGNDPLNATYSIDGQNITLVNGINEEQIPNSSSKIVTQIWDEPVYTDIGGNEVSNPALILTQESGGSGTYYYAVAAVNEDDGYYGTNGIILGDRIAIQSQEIMDDGTIVVNYADRPEGAPMSEQPSEAVSKYFKIVGIELVEFENPNL